MLNNCNTAYITIYNTTFIMTMNDNDNEIFLFNVIIDYRN